MEHRATLDTASETENETDAKERPNIDVNETTRNDMINRKIVQNSCSAEGKFVQNVEILLEFDRRF